MSPPQDFDIIALGELKPSEVTIVQSYLKITGQTGALVGAVRAEASWDLRPVLLERDELSVLRFAAAQPNLSAAMSNYAVGIADLLQKESTATGTIVSGVAQGRLWVRREWPRVKHALTSQREIILELLRFVERCHQSGVAHGHLAWPNVFLIGGTVRVVDFGFAALNATGGSSTESFPPEWRPGEVPKPAGDLFLLGKMLLEVDLNDFTPDQRGLVMALLNPHPGSRPIMRTLLDRFSTRGAGGVSEGSFKSGRLITTTNKGNSPSSEPTVSEQRRAETPRSFSPSAEPAASPDLTQTRDQKQTSDQRRSTQINPVIYVLLGILAVVLYLRFWGGLDSESDLPVETYWQSNQISLMRHVGAAAIADPDGPAALTVVGDALRGQKRTQVSGDFLRIVFDPRWEASLDETDRSLAFKSALSGLMGTDPPLLSDLQQRHPALLLAALATARDEAARKGAAINRLSELPEPYGPVFQGLIDQGINEGGEPVVFFAARIVSGDVSEEVIDGFLAGDRPPMLGRLKAVFPLAEQSPSFAAIILRLLARGPFGQLVSWFDEEAAGHWGTLAPAARLSLLLGKYPEVPLAKEQLIDLCSFPNPQIRDRARADLPAAVGPESGRIAGLVFRQKDKLLTREQLIILFELFTLSQEEEYTFLDIWFKTKPEPSLVLKILIARQDIRGLDPFNVEAARYLKDKNWIASLTELKALSLHPEPLARTLAYSRLDPKVPDQAEVLRAMAKVEPNQRIRDQIQLKIESAAAGPPAE